MVGLSKKFLNAALSALLAVTLLPLQAFADEGDLETLEEGNGIQYVTDADVKNVDPKNWLSNLPDDWRINEINMPGAHDAGTTYYGPWYTAGIPTIYGQCQNLSIPDQLKAGLRVLDIRLDGGGQSKWEDMVICHGVFNCRTGWWRTKEMRLHHVIEYCTNFLKENKNETIFLLVCEEAGRDLEATTKFLRQLKDYADANSSKFAYYREGEGIPTLGDVRGKIVFLDDEEFKTTTPYENHYWDKAYYTSTELKENYVRNALDTSGAQNFYQPRVADGKMTFCSQKDVYENAELQAGKKQGEPVVKVVYSSANGLKDGGDVTKLPKSPDDFANAMDFKGESGKVVFRRWCEGKYEYYPWQKGVRYGWIMMDFPLGSTIQRIIATNNKDIYNSKVTVTVNDPSGAFGDLKDLKMTTVNSETGAAVSTAKYNWLSDNKFEITGLPSWPEKTLAKYGVTLDLPTGWSYSVDSYEYKGNGEEEYVLTLKAPEMVTAVIHWDCVPQHQDILGRMKLDPVYTAESGNDVHLGIYSTAVVSDSATETVLNIQLKEDAPKSAEVNLYLQFDGSLSKAERSDNTHHEFNIGPLGELIQLSGQVIFVDNLSFSSDYRPRSNNEDFWGNVVLTGRIADDDDSYVADKYVTIPVSERTGDSATWSARVPKYATTGEELQWKLSGSRPLDGYSRTYSDDGRNVTYTLQPYHHANIIWVNDTEKDRPEDVRVEARAYFGQDLVVLSSAYASEATNWAGMIGALDADLDIALALTEVPEGYRLTNTTVDKAGFCTKFELTAISKEHDVYVANGSASPDRAAKGEYVTIQAGPAPAAGQVFDHWEVVSGAVQLSGPDAMVTNFVMPDEDVKLKAVFTDAPIAEYDVYVTNGSANPSSAEEGTTVTITADETPEGCVFDGWEVISGDVVLADAKATSTTFTMPASDVSLKAVFREQQSYGITIKGGTASLAKAKPGTKVRIVANTPEEGKSFQNWANPSAVVAVDDPWAATTFFEMPEADVELEAIFEDNVYKVEVEGGTSKPSEAKFSEQVSLHAGAADAGKSFKEWEVVSGSVSLSDPADPEATFAMPSQDVKLKAVYQESVYKVEVVNGTADPSEAKWHQTITLKANAAPAGQEFVRWQKVAGYDVYFDDPFSPETTFIMPDVDVKVEALYREVPSIEYDIHMGNGKASAAKAVEGTTVTVTADPAPEGQIFYYWFDTRGEVLFEDEGAETTTFSMPADEVWIQAVYGSATNAIHVSSGKANKSEAAPHEEVALVADPAPEGMEFFCWMDTYGNVDYADTFSPETTFEMPGTEVWIQAVYRPKDVPPEMFTVTMIDGTANYLVAPEGTEVTITVANVPEGKIFDRWEVVSGDVALADATKEVTTFIMPASDVTIQATFKDVPPAPAQYRITSGDGQTYTLKSGTGLKFTCNGPLDKFVELRIDGKAIDPKDYSCVSGSTVVTLKSEYLDSLSLGDHSIQFAYSDGESNVGTFVVKDSKKDPVIPVTGDSAGVLPVAALAVAALAAMLAAYVVRRRRA